MNEWLTPIVDAYVQKYGTVNTPNVWEVGSRDGIDGYEIAERIAQNPNKVRVTCIEPNPEQMAFKVPANPTSEVFVYGYLYRNATFSTGELKVELFLPGTTVDGQGNPVPDVGQLALSGSLTGAAVSSVVVSTSIPSDTPASGTIRVVNDDGYEVRIPYTSWAGSTFTLTGTFDFSGNNETESATTGNDVYITYIDKLATGTTETFTVLYNANRNLVVRVRDGGVSPIKTFITSAILTSAGGSTTAIRTSDA